MTTPGVSKSWGHFTRPFRCSKWMGHLDERNWPHGFPRRNLSTFIPSLALVQRTLKFCFIWHGDLSKLLRCDSIDVFQFPVWMPSCAPSTYVSMFYALNTPCSACNGPQGELFDWILIGLRSAQQGSVRKPRSWTHSSLWFHQGQVEWYILVSPEFSPSTCGYTVVTVLWKRSRSQLSSS